LISTLDGRVSSRSTHCIPGAEVSRDPASSPCALRGEEQIDNDDFTNPADGLTELQVSGVRLRDFDQPNTVLVQTSDPESGGLLQPEVPNFGSFHVIARVVRREEAQGPVVERGSWMRIDVAGTSRRITGSAQCNISGIVTPYG
jgi:hypothetical protein